MSVRLDPATIDAIAERVVELLREEGDAGAELVDAAEIARRFGVSRDWVYEHADRLGAVRLGNGPRARLRFNPAHVAEALNFPTPPKPRRAKPRQRRRADVELLPINNNRGEDRRTERSEDR